MQEQLTKRCPRCGGEINAAAIFCKHCRKPLEAQAEGTPSTARAQDAGAVGTPDVRKAKAPWSSRDIAIGIGVSALLAVAWFLPWRETYSSRHGYEHGALGAMEFLGALLGLAVGLEALFRKRGTFWTGSLMFVAGLCATTVSLALLEDAAHAGVGLILSVPGGLALAIVAVRMQLLAEKHPQPVVVSQQGPSPGGSILLTATLAVILSAASFVALFLPWAEIYSEPSLGVEFRFLGVAAFLSALTCLVVGVLGLVKKRFTQHSRIMLTDAGLFLLVFPVSKFIDFIDITPMAGVYVCAIMGGALSYLGFTTRQGPAELNVRAPSTESNAEIRMAVASGQDALPARQATGSSSGKAPASERLARLNELLSQGLITKDEYDAKREEIISGL